MSDEVLTEIRDLIQQDPGGRGFATDPSSNLLTARAGDFAGACRSLADTPNAAVAVVTGFFIPTAEPPGGETDGPLGAVFLARALTPLGVRVAILTDEFCLRAIVAGLEISGLEKDVRVLVLPRSGQPSHLFVADAWLRLAADNFRVTHLIALERVGPSHTPESIQKQRGGKHALPDFLREVPKQHHDRCHTMRGRDITDQMSPAHLLFEAVVNMLDVTTIGIGDGGNEIGMGKISWEVIHRNIPGGGKVACRVPTNHLIVAGVSNWGAYGLAAGVWHCLARKCPAELFDVYREEELLRIMVERGPLVDGVTGKQTVTVDGLSFEQYAEPLRKLQGLVAE